MNALDFILKLIELTIWPFIVIIVLNAFKKEFSGIFNRAKKVDLPGGISIETFQQKLEQTKVLASTIETKAPIGKSFSLPDEAKSADPKLQALQVRIDLDKKLREKGKQSDILDFSNIPLNELNKQLLKKGNLSEKEYMLSSSLIELTDGVMKGYPISKESAQGINDIYNKLQSME